jgi:hypothetical protein
METGVQQFKKKEEGRKNIIFSPAVIEGSRDFYYHLSPVTRKSPKGTEATWLETVEEVPTAIYSPRQLTMMRIFDISFDKYIIS